MSDMFEISFFNWVKKLACFLPLIANYCLNNWGVCSHLTRELNSIITFKLWQEKQAFQALVLHQRPGLKNTFILKNKSYKNECECFRRCVQVGLFTAQADAEQSISACRSNGSHLGQINPLLFNCGGGKTRFISWEAPNSCKSEGEQQRKSPGNMKVGGRL